MFAISRKWKMFVNFTSCDFFFLPFPLNSLTLYLEHYSKTSCSVFTSPSLQMFYCQWLNWQRRTEFRLFVIYTIYIVYCHSKKSDAQRSLSTLLSGTGMWIYSGVLGAPAIVIHLLHPTNSLITQWERLIWETPWLTINSVTASLVLIV